MKSLRTGLDYLYLASGILAALCLITILLLIVLQMLARWTGEVAPGIPEYAGYFMAAASFLAFANALNRGSHIRGVDCAERCASGDQTHTGDLVFRRRCGSDVVLRLFWLALCQLLDRHQRHQSGSGPHATLDTSICHVVRCHRYGDRADGSPDPSHHQGRPSHPARSGRPELRGVI